MYRLHLIIHLINRKFYFNNHVLIIKIKLSIYREVHIGHYLGVVTLNLPDWKF